MSSTGISLAPNLCSDSMDICKKVQANIKIFSLCLVLVFFVYLRCSSYATNNWNQFRKLGYSEISMCKDPGAIYSISSKPPSDDSFAHVDLNIPICFMQTQEVVDQFNFRQATLSKMIPCISENGPFADLRSFEFVDLDQQYPIVFHNYFPSDGWIIGFSVVCIILSAIYDNNKYCCFSFLNRLSIHDIVSIQRLNFILGMSIFIFMVASANSSTLLFHEDCLEQPGVKFDCSYLDSLGIEVKSLVQTESYFVQEYKSCVLFLAIVLLSSIFINVKYHNDEHHQAQQISIFRDNRRRFQMVVGGRGHRVGPVLTASRQSFPFSLIRSFLNRNNRDHGDLVSDSSNEMVNHTQVASVEELFIVQQLALLTSQWILVRACDQNSAECSICLSPLLVPKFKGAENSIDCTDVASDTICGPRGDDDELDQTADVDSGSDEDLEQVAQNRDRTCRNFADFSILRSRRGGEGDSELNDSVSQDEVVSGQRDFITVERRPHSRANACTGEVVKVPCGHLFHKKCVTQWTLSIVSNWNPRNFYRGHHTASCPVCRADLSNGRRTDEINTS